jgi:hypothetical protein
LISFKHFTCVLNCFDKDKPKNVAGALYALDFLMFQESKVLDLNDVEFLAIVALLYSTE